MRLSLLRVRNLLSLLGPLSAEAMQNNRIVQSAWTIVLFVTLFQERFTAHHAKCIHGTVFFLLYGGFGSLATIDSK